VDIDQFFSDPKKISVPHSPTEGSGKPSFGLAELGQVDVKFLKAIKAYSRIWCLSPKAIPESAIR